MLKFQPYRIIPSMEYLARLRQFRQKITLKTWNPHFKSFYRQNRSCHWLEIFSVCSKCKSHKAHTISASYDYSFYFFFDNFSKIWHLKSEIRVHSVPQGVDHLCIKGDISIDPPPICLHICCGILMRKWYYCLLNAPPPPVYIKKV